MSLKLFLKTHSICFVKSSSADFDYFLKGSRSLQLEELADAYNKRAASGLKSLCLIFNSLEDHGIKLSYNYDYGMFYDRIEVKASFEGGGLYCAAGGRFEEKRGVYVKGDKALDFLCEKLSNNLEFS
ncbi:hypothetical protein [Desertivirga arenae]|uniref:hypothetical protein n=1 Tax=Desertivirga arenae TaxID=2810309 RepID=UPI001A96BA8F|nr:hypothetical protein [Pedobacter sp. SYSU D00823]